MKLWISILLLAAVLTGCSSPVYETMGGVVHVGQEIHTPRNILLEIPQDATVLTVSGTDMLYVCDGYTMSLQNLPAGDLASTIEMLSGYTPDRLTIVESLCGDHKRYDWVWVAAGEGGDVLCRAAVLDDGKFHYSLCVTAEANAVADLSQSWNDLFSSFCLETENAA